MNSETEKPKVLAQKSKNRSKNNQNHKTEKSQCPLLMKNDAYVSLVIFHGGITQHPLTQLWKILHGVLGKKNPPTLHYVTQTLVWLVTQHLIFIENILIFSHPFFSTLYYFINDLIGLFLKTPFFRTVFRSVRFLGEQNILVGPALYFVTQTLFRLVMQNSLFYLSRSDPSSVIRSVIR